MREKERLEKEVVLGNHYHDFTKEVPSNRSGKDLPEVWPVISAFGLTERDTKAGII